MITDEQYKAAQEIISQYKREVTAAARNGTPIRYKCLWCLREKFLRPTKHRCGGVIQAGQRWERITPEGFDKICPPSSIPMAKMKEPYQTEEYVLGWEARARQLQASGWLKEDYPIHWSGYSLNELKQYYKPIE